MRISLTFLIGLIIGSVVLPVLITILLGISLDNSYQENIIPSNNNTITICEETIQRYTEPYNYIQPMHTPMEYFINKQENTLEIYNINQCWKLTGMSMQPTLFEGNTVCYQPFKGTTVKEGDIIAYEKYGSMITHRVRATYQGVDGKRIITQGDSLSEQDVITTNDIKYKVVAVIFT